MAIVKEMTGRNRAAKLEMVPGNTRDVDLIPEWERSPGEKDGNSLQYSCLENPMDRGAQGIPFTASQRIGHY